MRRMKRWRMWNPLRARAKHAAFPPAKSKFGLFVYMCVCLFRCANPKRCDDWFLCSVRSSRRRRSGAGAGAGAAGAAASAAGSGGVSLTARQRAKLEAAAIAAAARDDQESADADPAASGGGGGGAGGGGANAEDDLVAAETAFAEELTALPMGKKQKVLTNDQLLKKQEAAHRRKLLVQKQAEEAMV